MQTAEPQLHVIPSARRQRVGATVHEEATRLAVDAGRTQMYVEIDEPEGAVRGGAAGYALRVWRVGLTTGQPRTATQWGTFVVRRHRGRRLGITLELAVLRELQRVSPDTERIVTWNAETNAAMVRVNEALGFRRDGRRSAWSLRLDSRAA